MQISKIAQIILISLIMQLLIAIPLLWAEQNDLKDRDITNAVETELWLDNGVASHLIDVTTEDGVVTLSGSVDNILAEERAVEIAQATKGVRSVIEEIEVKAVERTDQEIRKDVRDALLFDPATDSFEIDVQVEDAAVTLTGTVESYAERWLCAEVTKGVKGVKEVNNKIEVSYEAKRPDDEIKAEIERRLQSDVRVDDGLITVEVNDGEVKLTGTVGSDAEKVQAKLDSWVAGVNLVDASELEIKWWARDEMRRKKQHLGLSDEQIKESLEDAFVYDPRVRFLEIDVDVTDSVVTLNGVVDNLKAKRVAEENAENTVGVRWVRNHLRVRPDEQQDSEIVEKVRNALSRSPYLDRYEISVSVYNARVFLYGVVDSFFEKYHAEDVVSRVKGVVEVVNKLHVNYEPTPRSDLRIEQSIANELFWDPFIESNEITVNVEDGVATLTGRVDTWFEFNKATKNARDGGARRVINKLKVEPGAE